MKVVKCEKMFMLDCLLGRDCGDSKGSKGTFSKHSKTRSGG